MIVYQKVSALGMKRPALLFMDNEGLSFLKRSLPQIEFESTHFRSLHETCQKAIKQVAFDLGKESWVPLPKMSFTRYRIRLSSYGFFNQYILLEAGYLSLGGWLLTERNPNNKHLKNLVPLQKRAIPGLYLPWWPWNNEPWRHVPGSRRSKRRAKVFSGTPHILSSFNNPNWYHWLGLPGLSTIPINENIKSIVLSDRSIYNYKNIPTPYLQRISTLARAVKPESKLFFDRGPLLLRELTTCFIHNHTPLACDATALQHLRLASAHLAISSFKIRKTNKLYLRRGPLARRPLHEEEILENALRQRGFDVLDPGLLPLPECIATFAIADWVVAPHGAALTNVVFSKPGTKVVEMLPGPLENYGHYALIAAALDLRYSYLIGSNIHGDTFKIDQRNLLNWLDAEILASAK